MFRSILEETMAEENWVSLQNAEKNAVPLLFPIGVIEAHGPHLPLGSDIYWSYAVSRLVKEKLSQMGTKSMIAPPYYWGINHCTGSFPGTFSLKPQTMRQVLFELLENLNGFGFRSVYCFNYHGDAAHVTAIVDVLKQANQKLDMSCKLVLNAMDLELYGWKGNEAFLLVVDPPYPMEWFAAEDPSEAGLLDIHAGAFETAVMNALCPGLVDLETATKLKSASLDDAGLQQWLQGGETAKSTVPLGYAGNPAGYRAVERHVAEMLDLQVTDIAQQIAAQLPADCCETDSAKYTRQGAVLGVSKDTEAE